MKDEILKRAMFAMPLSKSSRNSGIMEGFDEDDFADMEDDDLDELPPMARTPQNPEILMNNLRGDIRSTDSRYQELAEMVGESAAYETPPEVLAMLQPALAQQQQGIAALMQPQGQQQAPQGQPAPQQGAAPPAQGMQPPAPAQDQAAPPQMPQGPAPTDGGIAALPAGQPPMPQGQAPQGFAHGGIVQHFEEGSGPEGVTPAAFYPPELVAAAQQYASQALTATPRPVPELGATMQKRLPLYNELLGMGRSKEDMQTQMLLDLASRGLAFAGNVDDQGRPLRGSFASRLGQATRTLPGTMMALLGEKRKGEMAAKQLALQASEKEISQIQELNARDVEKQREMFLKIITEQAKAQGQSPIGKGDWAMAVVTRPGFITAWGEGKTTTDQDNLIEAAITKLKMPRLEYQQRINPTNNQPYMVTVEVPAVVPPFVLEAEKLRAKRVPSGAPTAGMPVRAPGAAPAAGAAAPAGATLAEAGPRSGEGPYPPKVAPTTYAAGDPTMFNLATMGTGPIPVAKTFIARVPIVGSLVDADQNIQANTFIDNAVNQLNKSLATNPRFAEGERKQIMQELQLSTRLIDRPEAYQQRLIGLDTLLTDLRSKAYREGYQNPNLGPDTIRGARAKVDEIDSIRTLIGVPPRVTTKADFDALPSDTPYILNGQLLKKR